MTRWPRNSGAAAPQTSRNKNAEPIKRSVSGLLESEGIGVSPNASANPILSACQYQACARKKCRSTTGRLAAQAYAANTHMKDMAILLTPFLFHLLLLDELGEVIHANLAEILIPDDL